MRPHTEYNNLRIYPKVGELERIVGLLNDLAEGEPSSTLAVYHWSAGGFVPIQCAKSYHQVHVMLQAGEASADPNVPTHVHLHQEGPPPSMIPPLAIFVDYFPKENWIDVNDHQRIHQLLGWKPNAAPNAYILCHKEVQLPSTEYNRVPIMNTNLVLYVPVSKQSVFMEKFRYYFDEDINFYYDNLIHLCIMVKNAGPMFEQVLTENLSIIDRWTILDTGSTDGTQDVIRRVLKDKKGALYEEPFINFRESRNRCLDLAGKHCKYLLMLDDTYAMRGDLRDFLTTVRGDQFASSYSLLIRSDDTEYYSNRVTMSERGLRYIYTIHEVIQDTNNKENVVIPKEAASIHDHRADYMEKRTMDRKRYDLQLLHDMLKEDPTNPRHYYYLAQTYNLLEEYEQAAYWFKRRATSALKGHDQEAVDSWFELARTYNFKLNRPWEECKHAYEEAYKMDPSRPEALYFIGIHYYLEGDRATAFKYFKDAFALGYPIHAQFSLKPTLVFHFLPKFLAELAYQYENWQLGWEACVRFLQNNKQDADQYEVMVNWYSIFEGLLQLQGSKMFSNALTPPKPFVAFVADGGWGPWTGSDILTKGVGGSETYIIELARWIQAMREFQVVVFCRCEEHEMFEGVSYQPIDNYARFIQTNKVHTSIISRYNKYIPMSIHGNVENIYFVLHDLFPSGTIIPLHPKIKKILCLTKWHEEYFLERFPQFKGRTDAFNYGIDNAKFKPSLKVKHSFIYSSFPNRGLLPLLQMWPRIKQALPDATLHVYADIEGKWVNEVAKDQMDEIRRLLATPLDGVTMHGWVSKTELADAWSKADIWFYPCIFQETFCLTALEAAASKTLAIAPPLAALQETVGDRGLLLPGNPMDAIWQTSALESILAILRDPMRKAEYLERNHAWSCTMSWKQRGEEFATKYLSPFHTPNPTTNVLVPPKLQLAGMKNWTHDIPQGQKKFFEEALRVANPKRILEVGTYAGVSLIEMLRAYPNAMGFAIDTWTDYTEKDNTSVHLTQNMEANRIESIFYENLEAAGMTQRVMVLKGDSADRLVQLLAQEEPFDFVYVDGSHLCLDCYMDMVLAWKVVAPGGVMAVDDVLYHANKVKEGDVLSYPLKAKEHFMEKYKGEYEVISDHYRLFLKKK